MSGYYAPDGSEIDRAEWCRLFELRRHDMSAESWWRKQTKLDGIEVSTVWIGLDHAPAPGDWPLVWETMITGLDIDEQIWRYTSRTAAFDDHDTIVKALRAEHA